MFRCQKIHTRFITAALLLLAAGVAVVRGGETNFLKAAPAVATNAILDSTYGLGSWIWVETRKNRQTCRFWKVFEIPKFATVKRAMLRVTADDNYELFLDGRRVGRGGDWANLLELDLANLLTPGKHVLGVEAFNDALVAGVILGLRVEFADGGVIEIGTDKTWRLAPKSHLEWEKQIVAPANWGGVKVVGSVRKSSWSQTPFTVVRAGLLAPIVEPPVRFWQTVWFQITMLSVCSAGALVIIYLLGQLATQSKAQRFLQRERARIARDIHDDVGARLTQLILLGERGQFDQVCARSREIMGAMDEVVWMVNSRHDTVQDFEAYVCGHAENFLQNTAIRCRLDVACEESVAAFDLAIRRNLFLAIKEALNNAAKHSGATELVLRIHPDGRHMTVVVADNGRGFSTAGANPQRDGLTNMSERIAEVGGTCRITSEPGKGCRVEFRTPLVHARKARWRFWKGDWQQRQEAAAQLDRAREVAAHTMGQVSKT